ncbi:hypothetical protein LOK49_LG12G02222 [Camellia lanceoleosa]|uniref:Uncharacterized protein n=1 Tax=Camellia lanceoleosa TaxID=1840588 RepID=A0ACC0FRF9_9ERIC|nr:hypothetical protein LOK49_LG12G02222 [Camellia lanceoleosa]
MSIKRKKGAGRAGQCNFVPASVHVSRVVNRSQELSWLWMEMTSDDIKVIAHGINVADVKKLQDVGIYTCNGLMMYTKGEQLESVQL